MFKTPQILQFAFPGMIWKANPSNKVAYLTFDDGPVPGVTDWVLNQLDEVDAKGTFFCVGENLKKSKSLAMEAISQGHTLGNHTYNHLNAWKTSKDDYLANVKKCKCSLLELGYESKYFRPPYGKITPSLISTISNDYKLVMWDILSKDYSAKRNPTEILNKLKQLTKPGSIVVFHDSLKGFKNLKSILPPYLSWLKDEKYALDAL